MTASRLGVPELIVASLAIQRKWSLVFKKSFEEKFAFYCANIELGLNVYDVMLCASLLNGTNVRLQDGSTRRVTKIE